MIDAKEMMCYVARKSCGCIIAATVDMPEMQKENAKEIGEWILSGYTVERVNVDYARANLTFNCKHKGDNEPAAAGGGGA